jgi:hypothetical protein
MLKQIVDGFSYNTALNYLPCRYFPNALASLDLLRRAANFRPRWFVAPDDIQAQPVQPYDTFYTQFEVPGGSRLWGYNFVSISELTPSGSIIAGVASHIAAQWVDNCSGVPQAQDVMNGGGCGSNFTARALPVLLTRPRVFLDPGTVNVELCNLTGNTITCQLLLMFAEPCRLIDEEEREMELSLAQGGRR